MLNHRPCRGIPAKTRKTFRRLVRPPRREKPPVAEPAWCKEKDSRGRVCGGRIIQGRRPRADAPRPPGYCIICGHYTSGERAYRTLTSRRVREVEA